MAVDLCKHLDLPETCNRCNAGQNGHDPSRVRDVLTTSSREIEEQEQEKKPRLWRTAKEVREAARNQPRRYWPVPGLLAPGLSLLFAKPKTGKTRLLVDIGWGVATGNPTLGGLTTHQGDVLMILSETTHAALDDIWQTTFPDEVDVPDRLSLVTMEDWREATGVYTKHPVRHLLEDWRQSVEKPVLVVIDNWQKCIAPYPPNGLDRQASVVDRDRRMIDPMQEWANKHQVSLVMIHHTSKAKIEKDAAWEDAASGSTAMTAGPDDLFMLYGEEDEEGRAALGLRYKGRSLGQNKEWTLYWRGGRIHMFDQVEISDRLGDQMRVVLEGLAQVGGEGSPKDVSDRTGVPRNTVQQYLIRLARQNLVVRSSRGVYRIGMVDESGG